MKKLLLIFFWNFWILNSITAQWQLVNTGTNSGLVNILMVDPSTGYLYAGLWESGIIMSTNNGITWNPINSGLTDLDVYSLAIKGNNIFAGTIGGGIFLSTNNGNSWTAVNNGITGNVNSFNIRALTINGSTTLAGTDYGIYSSIDNGSNWISLNNGLSSIEVEELMIVGSNIFAGTNGGGIFKSSNNGLNWATSNNGLSLTSVEALATNGSNIFAGLVGIGNPSMYLSINNGDLWTAKNAGLSPYAAYSLFINGSSLIAGTDGGVFLSTDNAENWTEINSGLPSTTVKTLTICGGYLFTGTNNGIYKRLLSEIGIITNIQKTTNQEIKVYPNPIKNFFVIDMNEFSSSNNTSIKISNMLGRTVLESKVTKPQIEINTTSWNYKGIYLLQVFDRNKFLLASKMLILQ